MIFNFKKTILYLALLTAICIICFRSVSQSSKPKEPKYRYFFSHEKEEIPDYFPTVDSLNKALLIIGTRLYKDESEAYQQIAFRCASRLIGKVVRDSVLIK